MSYTQLIWFFGARGAFSTFVTKNLYTIYTIFGCKTPFLYAKILFRVPKTLILPCFFYFLPQITFFLPKLGAFFNFWVNFSFLLAYYLSCRYIPIRKVMYNEAKNSKRPNRAFKKPQIGQITPDLHPEICENRKHSSRKSPKAACKYFRKSKTNPANQKEAKKFLLQNILPDRAIFAKRCKFNLTNS